MNRRALLLLLSLAPRIALASAATTSAAAPWQLLDSGPAAPIAVGWDATGQDAAAPAAQGTWILPLPEAFAPAVQAVELYDMVLALAGFALDGGKCATGLTYRIERHLSVSPDAGQHWWPLTPQCSAARSNYAKPRVVAADGGMPGHIVVASFPGHDAGGCATAKDCMRRQVAWNWDVGPQAQVSMLASVTGPDGGTGTAAYPLDHAGFAAHGCSHTGCPVEPGWRYASTQHLLRTTTAAWLAHRTCSDPQGNTPEVCAPSYMVCHADRAGADPNAERGCPSLDGMSCACAELTDTDCERPEIQHLAIDPRNGYVYAASPAGLLLSRDGGRVWQRAGSVDFARYALEQGMPAAIASHVTDPRSPHSPDAPSAPAAQVLTFQGLKLQGGPGPGPLALNLNAQPELIESMSPIAMAFAPCVDATRKYAGTERRRGQMVATLSVQWRNPHRPEQSLRGVFVASEDGACEVAGEVAAPGPLVFRDGVTELPRSDVP